jgi:hypothetical protein
VRAYRAGLSGGFAAFARPRHAKMCGALGATDYEPNEMALTSEPNPVRTAASFSGWS